MSWPWHADWTRERWYRALHNYRDPDGPLSDYDSDVLFIRNLAIDQELAPFERGPWWTPLRERLESIKLFGRQSYLWPGRGTAASLPPTPGVDSRERNGETEA